MIFFSLKNFVYNLQARLKIWFCLSEKDHETPTFNTLSCNLVLYMMTEFHNIATIFTFYFKKSIQFFYLGNLIRRGGRVVHQASNMLT